MSIFKKRSGGMIDVVDMQKRGLIKLPARKPSVLKASKDGFVELQATPAPDSSSATADNLVSNQEPAKEEKSGGWFGTFFGGGDSSPKQAAASQTNFSTQAEGYDKREVDSKIQELDNKIYRLEQRLEVLERKSGVGSW